MGLFSGFAVFPPPYFPPFLLLFASPLSSRTSMTFSSSIPSLPSSPSPSPTCPSSFLSSNLPHLPFTHFCLLSSFPSSSHFLSFSFPPSLLPTLPVSSCLDFCNSSVQAAVQIDQPLKAVLCVSADVAVTSAE